MKNLLLILGLCLGFSFNSNATTGELSNVAKIEKSNYTTNEISANEITTADVATIAQEAPAKKGNFISKIKHKIYEIPAIKSRFPAGEKSFYFGSFLMGFFFGILGVLIVYLINKNKDDVRKAKMKSVFIGFGISLILTILSLL